MKSLTAVLLLALFALSTHTPASSQVLNNMSGKTNVHNASKSCSAYATACVKTNAGAGAKCQSARARCMETGTFVGVQGQSFSGLAKQ
jgi:hypothetical protein